LFALESLGFAFYIDAVRDIYEVLSSKTKGAFLAIIQNAVGTHANDSNCLEWSAIGPLFVQVQASNIVTLIFAAVMGKLVGVCALLLLQSSG
jgi:hypothetical protein